MAVVGPRITNLIEMPCPHGGRSPSQQGISPAQKEGISIMEILSNPAYDLSPSGLNALVRLFWSRSVPLFRPPSAHDLRRVPNAPS
jgi:hypothetical protein